MDDIKSISCCFTGHRKIPDGELDAIIARTEGKVRELISAGITRFLVGGAVGFDSETAKLLFRLRATEFPDIEVVLIYPFDGYTSRWNDAQKEDGAHLLPMYSDVVRAAPAASRGAYLKRDRLLVDGASCCIAYCTKGNGGTAYTVRYAKSRGVPVFNVAASAQQH